MKTISLRRDRDSKVLFKHPLVSSCVVWIIKPLPCINATCRNLGRLLTWQYFVMGCLVYFWHICPVLHSSLEFLGRTELLLDLREVDGLGGAKGHIWTQFGDLLMLAHIQERNWLTGNLRLMSASDGSFLQFFLVEPFWGVSVDWVVSIEHWQTLGQILKSIVVYSLVNETLRVISVFKESIWLAEICRGFCLSTSEEKSADESLDFGDGGLQVWIRVSLHI